MPVATSQNPFTPDPNDGALLLLRDIFGSAISHIATSGAGQQATSALGVVFGYLNSGVLFFGSILLTYVTIFGIANTANDGEALGRKWSSFYTPLRTLTSASVLIPGGSGFNGIQILILTFVCWSIGFASNLWEKAVQGGLTTQIAEQAVQAVATDENLDNLMITALKMQTCARAVSSAVQKVTGVPSNLQLYQTQPIVVKNADRIRYTTSVFYKDPNWAGSENLCGKITYSTSEIKVPELKETSSFRESRGVQQMTVLLQKTIEDTKAAYIRALFLAGPGGPLGPIVDKIATAAETEEGTVSAQELANLAAQHKELLTQRIKEAVAKALNLMLQSSTQELSDTLSQGGWIYAGSYYPEISRIFDAIRTTQRTNIQFTAADANLEGVLTGDMLVAANSLITRYKSIIAPLVSKTFDDKSSNGSSAETASIPRLRTDFSVDDFTDNGNGIKNSVENYFYHSFGDSILSYMTTRLGSSKQDPLLQIKTTGDYLMLLGESVMMTNKALTVAGAAAEKYMDATNGNIITGTVAGAAGNGGALIASVIKGFNTLVAETWKSISFAVNAITYCGYFMSIWFPMIPFYIFAIGVVGWVIAVVESVIAGSLWAVMHMTPEDSFIGSQKQGYMLLLSVFFRPALMVAGLFVSMIAAGPITNFINIAFVGAFRAVQVESMTGIGSIAGYLIGYVFVQFSVLTMLFGLSQSIPDRVLNWIGGGIGQLGEQNSMARLESGASSQARTAVMGSVAMSARRAGKGRDSERDAEGVEKSNRIGAGSSPDKAASPEGHGGQSNVNMIGGKLK
ncbi:DotA/TraY family protein [Chromobacterium phragmitis]|uniref:DotA/TraY family protein n=1 Tax=Chromobacterium amazonense TaxID=1382803 RepID=UPI0021B80A6F|nr:DotA/TraY family protein [Chromobacterium amazonense]MBM2886761.1 DotA/TraY family protein [Chromobacterium amazonense]